MIELNSDQLTAKEKMVDFFHATGTHFFLLEGFAGTGKTTTIQQTVMQLKEEDPKLNICFAATTNKAVKVLAEMAFEHDLQVDCATIHSILGLVVTADGEEKQTRKMVVGHFDTYDLVVIDEISMASKYLWSVIESHAHEQEVKVILMGDKNQLPPVKESESPAFKLVDDSHRLTKVMRQAEDNPIQILTAELRSAVEYGTSYRIATDLNSEGFGVRCVNAKTFALWVEENFSSDEYRDNPNAFRCLAWTNKRVETMNKRLRKLLVGITESPFIAGERVIARQPISSINSFTGQIEKPIIKTDEECKVLNVFKTEHPAFNNSSESFQVWAIELISDTDEFETAYVLHDDSREAYQAKLDKLVKIAKSDHTRWKDFWGFKDLFADLQPPHAMTIHRSQGSTYENVFIDILDIGKNRKEKERTQLLYVGCSRASENLVVMDRIE